MSWVAKLDIESGKTYYYNKESRETTWTKPVDLLDVSEVSSMNSKAKPSASAPDEGGLPENWVEKIDPASGKPYYYNRTSRETSWKRPSSGGTKNVPTAAEVALSSDAAASRARPDESPGKHSEWVARNDPQTGKVYYYNPSTRATTWTKPLDAEVPTATASPPPTAATVPPAEAAHAVAMAEWMPKVDDRTGKTYYYNVRTRETSWVEPSSATLASPPRDTENTPARVATPTAASPREAAEAPRSASSPAVPTSTDGKQWAEKVDPASGKRYYYNRDTKETSWTKPSMSNGPTQPPSPQGSKPKWEQRQDPKSGKTYYYNPETRETSWNPPSQDPQVAGHNTRADGAAASPHSATNTTASAGDKFANWTKRVDYRTGQFMYYNVVTGETQWTDPSEPQPTLTLPLMAEVLFCIGGNERPPNADLEAMLASGGASTYQSVEMFEGNQWVSLQNGCLDARKTKNPRQLANPILPFDVEDITAIRTSRSECIVFGKRVIDRTSVCFQWNTDTLVCTPRYDLQGLVAYGAAFAAVSSGVVATGGYLDNTMRVVANDAIVMNLKTSSPFLLPKMNFKRANHAIAVIDVSNSERLLWFAFVFGGFDGERKSNTVERYVLGKPTWEVMNNMPTPRSGHCAVAVDRTIYVLGGRSGYRVLSDVEYMHVQSDTWSTARPMNQPRANFGAVYVGNFLIAVGGWDGTKFLSSVEAYDPRIDAWRKVSSLPFPKQHIGLVVMRRVKQSGETVVTSVQ